MIRTRRSIGEHPSYFDLCLMQSPGIEIRPITEMTGGQTFNEVFFNDGCIPADSLPGRRRPASWALAKVTLGNERASLLFWGGALLGSGPTAEDLLNVVRAAVVAAPITRSSAIALRACTSKARSCASSALRTLTARLKGAQPGPESSVRKIPG